jgi:hypothetical protein
VTFEIFVYNKIVMMLCEIMVQRCASKILHVLVAGNNSAIGGSTISSLFSFRYSVFRVLRDSSKMRPDLIGVMSIDKAELSLMYYKFVICKSNNNKRFIGLTVYKGEYVRRMYRKS